MEKIKPIGFIKFPGSTSPSEGGARAQFIDVTAVFDNEDVS